MSLALRKENKDCNILKVIQAHFIFSTKALKQWVPKLICICFRVCFRTTLKACELIKKNRYTKLTKRFLKLFPVLSSSFYAIDAFWGQFFLPC